MVVMVCHFGLVFYDSPVEDISCLSLLIQLFLVELGIQMN